MNTQAIPAVTPVGDPLTELAGLIERYASHDGTHATGVPGLHLNRISRPIDPRHGLQRPALAVIAQGSKRLMVGDDVYVYDAANYLVTSVDLPGISQVVVPAPEHPYLSLRLDLDAEKIGALMHDAALPPLAEQTACRGLFVARVGPPLLDAVLRLARLLDTPRDIPILAPLIEREILYRLLMDGQGERLRQIALAGSHTHRVVKAISWLREHYQQPLRVDDIARSVNMSASSLHHHFKAVTAMSPLQYQKQLRLQEARRLMLNDAADAATAGHRVGYGSASQFSREYRRLFGAPPVQDIARLREAA